LLWRIALVRIDPQLRAATNQALDALDTGSIQVRIETHLHFQRAKSGGKKPLDLGFKARRCSLFDPRQNQHLSGRWHIEERAALAHLDRGGERRRSKRSTREGIGERRLRCREAQAGKAPRQRLCQPPASLDVLISIAGEDRCFAEASAPVCDHADKNRIEMMNGAEGELIGFAQRHFEPKELNVFDHGRLSTRKCL